MTLNEPEKSSLPPPPPVKWLFKDTEFWAKIASILDTKDQWMTNNGGYGRFGVELVYYNGKLVDILWSDKVNDKLLVEKTQTVFTESPSSSPTSVK